MIRRTMFVVGFAVLVAACGSTDDAGDNTSTSAPSTTEATTSSTTLTSTTTTTEAPDDGFPVTIEAPNGPVTIEEKPESIVSLSPTATEVLFAIGAGSQVVAVDDQSNYPAKAPVTDLSGFTPNVEAIAAYEPDLVIVSYDPGELISGLDALGIPVILHGAAFSVADAYTQWEQLGVSTGNLADSVALVAATQARIDDAYGSLPPDGLDASYYWELDQTFYSITSITFIGELLSGANLSNIADESDPDGYGYPQLTAEYIIGSNPGLVVLADTKCCGQTAETVAGRPGWDSMTAVALGHILEMDDDVASRWGPRIADLVEQFVAAALELVTEDA